MKNYILMSSPFLHLPACLVFTFQKWMMCEWSYNVTQVQLAKKNCVGSYYFGQMALNE